MGSSFKDKLRNYLDDGGSGFLKLRNNLVRAPLVAEEFQVGTSTVARWADGLTAPHPRLQEKIIEWIEQREEQ